MIDLSLGSLNATYINALFKDCLIKDTDRQHIAAVLFQKEQGFNEDSRPIFFDKEIVDNNKKTIDYVLGQLKDVYEGKNSTSMKTVVNKYDNTIWTENRNVIVAFLHLALAAGSISPLNAKTGRIDFIEALMPTKDVFDAEYGNWYSQNKEEIIKRFENK